MNTLDWNHVRAFHAAVEAGSLSAAAKGLGLSQPTLSRQVAALEEALGVALFERVGKRLVLTEPGQALAEHARSMQVAAGALGLAAAGRSESIEGTVSVSASDAVSLYLLPAIVARLREVAPGLVVQLVVSNALSDLRRREADIAVRHVRPEGDELIGRLIRHAEASFYASRDWVARHGHPRTAADAVGAAFIGPAVDDRFAGYLRQLGLTVGPGSFPVVSENSVVAWELARRGVGIAAIMQEIAAQMPDLVQVLDELPAIRFPIWLVAHREVRTSRRVRLVFDALAEGLGEAAIAESGG